MKLQDDDLEGLLIRQLLKFSGEQVEWLRKLNTKYAKIYVLKL